MNDTELSPIWNCPSGTVQGWYDEEKNVLRATGIRYATAERFEKPVAEPKAEKVIKATNWSPASPQPRDEYTERLLNKESRRMEIDEHCQFLSVTIPENAKSTDQLPVMVWIHGGAYVTGGGDYPIYDPAVLANEQQVIVVTVTYRLGMLGYLGSEDTTPANLGLLDQIEALKWVKQNITSFGGDPENTTVFGESSGGDAISHLMISEGTEGLFNRAIIQSAPFGVVPKPELMTALMLEEKKQITKNTSLEKILEVQTDIEDKVKPFGTKSAMPFGVQYGEFPLPSEENREKAWKKVAEDIKVLVGHNNREMAPFIRYIAGLNKLSKAPVIGKYIFKLSMKSLTKEIYSNGVDQFTKRHRRGGGRGYKYTISGGAKGNNLAGGHASEIPLLFENHELWENSPVLDGITWEKFHRQGLALRNIWGEFARTGKTKPIHIHGLIRVESITMK